ncbi:MAG: ribokinase [Betaproteobacteria bacterium]
MILVFGSINVDLVSKVDRFPMAGETVRGDHFSVLPGGKGGNQALAAARAGGRVSMFGAVGRDAFADLALANLADAGVDLRGVSHVEAPTGCATILVERGGENRIVIVAGANSDASAGAPVQDALVSGATLVLQQEVPTAANLGLAQRARAARVRVVLNAAPARALSREFIQLIDVLVVNESEAASLAGDFGWPTSTWSDFAKAARHALAPTRDAVVVVTLGAEGALCCGSQSTLRAIAPRVDAIDTTGAGDAFVGTLAAALDAGATLDDALRRAVAAGSLACTRFGAQAAMPDAVAIAALSPSITLRPL